MELCGFPALLLLSIRKRPLELVRFVYGLWFNYAFSFILNRVIFQLRLALFDRVIERGRKFLCRTLLFIINRNSRGGWLTGRRFLICQVDRLAPLVDSRVILRSSAIAEFQYRGSFIGDGFSTHGSTGNLSNTLFPFNLLWRRPRFLVYIAQVWL